MQVLITLCDGAEFQALCDQFLGGPAEFLQDFVIARAPGTGDRCVIYRVPDHTAMATWITLARPGWIDYSWTRHDQSVNSTLKESP